MRKSLLLKNRILLLMKKNPLKNLNMTAKMQQETAETARQIQAQSQTRVVQEIRYIDQYTRK